MSVRRPVYMDHHATTPVDPRVLEAMQPYFAERFGNPASPAHRFGREAAEAVAHARAQVAAAIGAAPEEIVFTSGGTESDNLALAGVVLARGAPGAHVVTAATEHKAVLETLRRLERHGCTVTLVPVDREGRVDPQDIARAIRPETVLVSFMAANNEIGVLHDLAAVGEVARRHGVLFHSDAVQALGRVPLDVRRAGLDLLSLSAHKIYGPKGVGALYVRREVRARLAPLLAGGGQEGGLRSGTLNVAGIVGFGAAVELAQRLFDEEVPRLAALRDRLWAYLEREVEDVGLNGPRVGRLAHNLNVSFGGLDGEALVQRLAEEVALSTGSACVAGRGEPSHVLRALGWPAERIRGSVRFGLGRFHTQAEVDFVAARVAEQVRELRRLAPSAGRSGARR